MYTKEQNKRIKELIAKAEKCGMVHRKDSNDLKVKLMLKECELNKEDMEYYNKISR